MNKKLLIAVGLAIGLPLVNAKADFSSYYAIPNPGPGAVAAIPVGNNTLPLGNWKGSATVVPGLFSRSPDSADLATAFTLTAGTRGTAKWEIVQPTAAQFSAQNLLGAYTFTWNLNLKGADQSWFVDSLGQHFFTTPVGSATFKADPGAAGNLWGFYITATSGITTEALQIQGWNPVPEPSSIAMGLITCLGAAGFAVRRYQTRKA